MVTKLKECGLKIGYRVMSAAGIGGDISTIEYVLDNYEGDIDQVTTFVAGSRKVGTMKWVIEKGYIVTSKVSEMAVRSGKLKMVEYLREIGADFPENICCCCTYTKDHEEALEMLKYLIREGFGVDEYMVGTIAVGGNCRMLAYLLDQGYSYPSGMYKSVLKEKEYFEARSERTGREIKRDYTEMIALLEERKCTN